MSDGENQSLFRVEVLRHRGDRLHGEVGLATPLAWQVIGLLLLAAHVAGAAFLVTASYSRVETAVGTVTLDKGLATIVPSRAGVTAVLPVVEGQKVKAGQLLAQIRSEEDMIGGNTASARVRNSLAEQGSQLAAQGNFLITASSAERGRLQEQVRGIAGELDSLEAQISDQRRLIDVASSDFENAQRVAVNGFISRRDLDLRQTTLLSRRQQLAQLEQLRASKAAAIAEAERTMTQAQATAESQRAGAKSQRAGLAQLLAQAELSRGYNITSPVDGVVTALTARLGQPVNVQQQLMMVVPANAKLRVELYVPTSAAGFVRPGQDVRVAIDAFPYQQFGALPARVGSVSAATIARPGAGDLAQVYLVTAELDQPWIKAFGKRQPLIPGMTLTARIVTERRSLMKWLFEPIFAVRSR